MAFQASDMLQLLIPGTEVNLAQSRDCSSGKPGTAIGKNKCDDLIASYPAFSFFEQGLFHDSPMLARSSCRDIYICPQPGQIPVGEVAQHRFASSESVAPARKPKCLTDSEAQRFRRSDAIDLCSIKFRTEVVKSASNTVREARMNEGLNRYVSLLRLSREAVTHVLGGSKSPVETPIACSPTNSLPVQSPTTRSYQVPRDPPILERKALSISRRLSLRKEPMV
jgi:hypothetical protein